MLARDSDAARVNDVGLDAAGPQPARQPKAVSTRLERNGETPDRPARAPRLLLPAAKQPHQRFRLRIELLQWMALEPGDDPGDQPV